MKQIFLLFFVFSLTLHPKISFAAESGTLPPKAKAFLTVAGYGAGGGALLGLATMAFGNSSRAVAQGASLGLYTGILFGAYVLVSHHQRNSGMYDDRSSPYQESEEYYNEPGAEGEDKAQKDGFFGSQNSGGKLIPPIKMQLFSYAF